MTVPRKTMAERYATQRSHKESRRRSLPRLSDMVPTAVQEREFDDVPEGPEDTGGVVSAVSPGPTDTRERRLPHRATSQRALPVRRRGLVVPTATVTHVDYSYVKQDLRRIALTAVVMVALLVVLNIGLQHFIQ
jgi:hypothetical protein